MESFDLNATVLPSWDCYGVACVIQPDFASPWDESIKVGFVDSRLTNNKRGSYEEVKCCSSCGSN